jgi:hypothetical protein
VHIAFDVAAAAAVPATTVQLLTVASVGGTEYRTQVDDSQGQLLLGPGSNQHIITLGNPIFGHPVSAIRHRGHAE